MIASLINAGLALLGLAGITPTTTPPTQEQLGWGRAAPMPAAGAETAALDAAIAEWNNLRDGSARYSFETYARFLLAHPGWPGEAGLRDAAERALEASQPGSALVVSFFRRFPARTPSGKARFALALKDFGARDEAAQAARTAWTSASLNASDETAILANFADALRPEDHDARMDYLLWRQAKASAGRQISLTSAGRRALFQARLALISDAPDAAALAAGAEALRADDMGFIAARATWLRNNGAAPSARSLLAAPRNYTRRPASIEAWLDVLLTNAREAANDGQFQMAFDIARQADFAFAPGTDISKTPLSQRDDYTSLVWLAGQTALKNLGRPADAAQMFERYASGSQTPQSKSKGLYWAGRASDAAGRKAEAAVYLTRAAEYRDQFYGQLASERLGLPLAAPANPTPRSVEASTRQSFFARETVRAAQYLGTLGRWEDQTLFVRQIANDAKSEPDHVLATELSRTLGRPDLGVMIGRSAAVNGIRDYTTIAFPNVRVPDEHGENWVLIHAIARQESQFDRAAISRAGARGLMQLMPGTARETAGKIGMSYDMAALTRDTDYNIALGSTYFQRVLNQYGSYPLAVAAYNAGPGNVNKWLRANGDPRTPGVDMVEWIEAIPIQETRNYVQRVLENAVVYDLMNPAKARSQGAHRISWYLGKQQPG